ncbi:GNAT family N-acetyltransferase [Glycomyces sp. TRM65418]|uniref:GNAT family N-acetyltransferase n=1 Tax=Glycomyces sp. TRM65418 TaxID=2867006 RepID=UPI001CE5171F|nr:GNAT family N-acetyltransferase [Glycomyces sp. TRM65418]MCC3764271.1 GNAT family N-acetyltransferase [Glycomyces sp. TRM65418]QZD53955.1 GNAT family N-acetyltransferase [Glycomyces sp. TRM65418]
MELHRVHADDREALLRVRGLFELVRATETPELAPVPERVFTGMMTNPPPDTAYRCYTASEDGTLLGALWLSLPGKENDHYVEADLIVHPDHRRRGVGTALLDRLLALAREQSRREVVVLARIQWNDGPARPDAGVRFLERHGFTAALTEVDRSLRLDAIDPETEERLWREAAAAAEDYEPVSWIGRCPEAYLEGLARLNSMIFAEIPLGDVELHPRTVDAESVRAAEAGAAAVGNAMIRTIAVPKGGGDVVAHTVIAAHEGEAHVGQGITIVDPAHRGHRLGLLVKLANLRRLREHFGHVTHVWAGNADTNAHMVAINDLLGYRPVDARVCYKRRIEA